MARESQRLKISTSVDTWINIAVEVAQVVYRNVVSIETTYETGAVATKTIAKPPTNCITSPATISDARAALNTEILTLRDELYACTEATEFHQIVEKINHLYDLREAEENNGKEKAYN